MTPKIQVEQVGNQYRLMSFTPTMGALPAGPRLLRLNPPAIKFIHQDKASAVIDAARLQEHLDTSPSLSRHMVNKAAKEGRIV